MNSCLKECLLTITSVVSLEPTYFTAKSGKWLVIVKKVKKDQARQEIDQIINNTIFPDSQVEKTGRSNHHNITPSSCLTLKHFKKKQLPLLFNFTIHLNM